MNKTTKRILDLVMPHKPVATIYLHRLCPPNRLVNLGGICMNIELVIKDFSKLTSLKPPVLSLLGEFFEPSPLHQ